MFSGKHRKLMHISVSYSKGIRNTSMKSDMYRNSTRDFFQVNLYKLIIPTQCFNRFFLAILIGTLVKLNGFYISINPRAYEYLISALISQCL